MPSMEESEMEDILDKFEDSFNVESVPNSTSRHHPWSSDRFRSNVRLTYSKTSQSGRRRSRLEEQRRRRSKHINNLRDIQSEEKPADHSEHAKTVKSAHRRKDLKHKVMLSEWMVEIPDDLASDWTMVACPVGKRNLVVAQKGKTLCYTKNGYCLFEFKSLLPGGFYDESTSAKDCTVLDCVFDQAKQTFYILDVLVWRTHPVQDSEREFRSYWLRTKYEETTGNLDEISDVNACRFKIIEECKADTKSMTALLSKTFEYEVDGLLFYDLKGHYTEGSTPLCLWLKCYMMEELLDVAVHKQHIINVPADHRHFKIHARTLKSKILDHKTKGIELMEET